MKVDKPRETATRRVCRSQTALPVRNFTQKSECNGIISIKRNMKTVIQPHILLQLGKLFSADCDLKMANYFP